MIVNGFVNWLVGRVSWLVRVRLSQLLFNGLIGLSYILHACSMIGKWSVNSVNQNLQL
jgi:hypothetical protein